MHPSAPAILIASLLTGLMTLAECQVSSAYVDFGASDLPTPSPDANGHFWNNVGEATSNLSNLVSDAGAATGISLSVSGFGTSQGANKNGSRFPDASALGGLAVGSATSDGLYISGAETITLRLSNLAPDGIYRLSLFASREIDQKRVTRYDVTADGGGGTRKLQTSGTGLNASPQPTANCSNLAVFDGLSSANGVITIVVSKDTGDYGYIGALRLETMNQTNSPPAADLVLSSGSLRVGSRLVGSYAYSDADNDVEGASSFIWERASSAGGAPVQVAGASTATMNYVIQPADEGCYLRFGVVPVASTGRPQGTVVYSGWCGPIHASGTLATFHIGNSFTRWSNIPLQLETLSKSVGSDIAAGFQLHDGMTLRFDWEHGNPGGGIMSGTPARSELATGTWDAVILQPMSREWLMTDDFKDYAKRFYDLADANGTTVYLFDYWPYSGESLSFQTTINSTFEQVRSYISAGGRKPALVIPVGEVFRAVAAASGRGALSGIDRSSLYLDDRHPSNLGGYISALTHYATLYKRSPVGVSNATVNAEYGNDIPSVISPEVATRLQQIVWEVVGSYPNSGVSVLLTPTVPAGNPTYVHHDPALADPALLAYAFGPVGNPGVSPAQSLPHLVQSSPAGFSMEYYVNSAAEQAGVTYAVEWSSDLVNWSAVLPSGTAAERVGDKVKITMPAPESGKKRFARVYVHQTEP